MANIFYDPILSGTAMQIYKDPQVITKVDFEAARDDLINIQAIPQSLREDLALQGVTAGFVVIPGFPTPDPEQPEKTPLELFDEYVDAELDRVSDILDYFDYESGTAGFSVRTGDWFLPEAVEDVSDEDVGQEATLAIDAVGGGDPDPNDPLNTTYWSSSTPGLRVITFRLRSYTKRCEGIRLRTNNGDTRAQLQGLTVKASNSLGQIDAPENLEASGVNVDDAAGWFEINFVKVKCRYIRLEASTSAFGDVLRIRSIQARVGITNHDK